MSFEGVGVRKPVRQRGLAYRAARAGGATGGRLRAGQARRAARCRRTSLEPCRDEVSRPPAKRGGGACLRRTDRDLAGVVLQRM